MISFEDFAKLDLRVGVIKEAQRAEGTDKLLRFVVDIGEDTPRQIMAGIAEYVEDSEALVGAQCVVVANLETKRLRGFESEGMILAAGDDASGFALVTVSKKTAPGTQVR